MCRKPFYYFFYPIHVGFLLADLPQLVIGTAWLSTSDRVMGGVLAAAGYFGPFVTIRGFICTAKSSSGFKGVWVWWQNK